MKNSLAFKDARILTVIVGIFAISLLVVTHARVIPLEDHGRSLIAPPKLIKHLSFGYAEALADSLWIRALQDFDYCESEVAKNTCKNNTWLYQMLDTTTDLSPHFRMPYATGGVALSVLVGDVEGAAKFFEKGVREFPKDWPILYRAAYHYLYEVKDKKRAAELLIEAGKYGAPPWVFSLAGRLYSDSGNLELAEALLQEMKDSKQDPTLIERLEKKIESIKAEGSKK